MEDRTKGNTDCQYKYILVKSLGLVRFLDVFDEISYVRQSCIYLIKNVLKTVIFRDAQYIGHRIGISR